MIITTSTDLLRCAFKYTKYNEIEQLTSDAVLRDVPEA